MRIAVIGSGPSGSTVATLLASNQHDVVIFEKGFHPPLLVGESLIPAVIPLLRTLGIEDQVAAISTLKPGVTFHPSVGETFSFKFEILSAKYPRYAYNVPRPAFDEILRQNALRTGVHFVKAEILPIVQRGRVILGAELCSAVPRWQGAQPDLVIDASGRRRVLAKALGLGSEIGPRRDVAFFAHFEGLDTGAASGHVSINRLSAGWSWRIPLPGCTSFGMVVPRDFAKRHALAPEEILESTLAKEPTLKIPFDAVRRISPTLSYANYQLISQRGVGPNWAAVGDAFGFVDPMLSPGVWMAMKSAFLLAAALEGADRDLQNYEQTFRQELKAWMDLVARFYDGRIFYLHTFGTALRKRWRFVPFGVLERLMSSTLAAMASGFETNSIASRHMLSSFESLSKVKHGAASRYAIS